MELAAPTKASLFLLAVFPLTPEEGGVANQWLLSCLLGKLGPELVGPARPTLQVQVRKVIQCIIQLCGQSKAPIGVSVLVLPDRVLHITSRPLAQDKPVVHLANHSMLQEQPFCSLAM